MTTEIPSQRKPRWRIVGDDPEPPVRSPDSPKERPDAPQVHPPLLPPVPLAKASLTPAATVENESVGTNQRHGVPKAGSVQKPKPRRSRDDLPLPPGWKKIDFIFWRTESGSLRHVCRKTEPLVVGAIKVQEGKIKCCRCGRTLSWVYERYISGHLLPKHQRTPRRRYWHRPARRRAARP